MTGKVCSNLLVNLKVFMESEENIYFLNFIKLRCEHLVININLCIKVFFFIFFFIYTIYMLISGFEWTMDGNIFPNQER